MLFDTPDVTETDEERLRRQLLEGGVNSLAADAFMKSPAAAVHLATGGPVYGNINPMAVDMYQKASPGLEAPGVLPMALDIYNKAQSKDYHPLTAGLELNATATPAPTFNPAANIMGPANPYAGIMGPPQPTDEDYRNLPIGTMLGNSRVSGGGAIVNDGFNASGNLIGTNSPNPTEYTGPGAGYARLPSAGDSRYGAQINLAAAIDDANAAKLYAPQMALAHKYAMAKQDALLAGQMAQTLVATGNKPNGKEKAINDGLKIIGDPKIPNSVADAKIQEMANAGDMDSKSANFARMERNLSASLDGKTFVPITGTNNKTGEFNLKEIVTKVPTDIPAEDVQEFLAQKRGIDINKVKTRYIQLLEKGSGRNWDPSYNPNDWLRKDVSTFNINNLTGDDKTEYEGILRLFGRRK